MSLWQRLKDVQTSFQILRLFAVSCLSHTLHTVPPSITHGASAAFDTLVGWASASIIAGDGAIAVGNAHLAIQEHRLGLTSSDAIKYAAPAWGNLSSLLERPPERPVASVLRGQRWRRMRTPRGIGTLLVEFGTKEGRIGESEGVERKKVG